MNVRLPILALLLFQLGISQAQFATKFVKISATQGGFTASLSPAAKFGIKADAIGDINNDGVTDIAVAATNQGGNLRGSVFVILLKSNGGILNLVEIPAPEPGNQDSFGSAVAGIGDLDDDGVEDIAVGGGYDSQDGGDRGAIWIYFLTSTGNVKSFTKINNLVGNFTGTPSIDANFGTGMAGLGDLDGDGVEDVAVGADRDDDTGTVYVLFLNTNGTVKSHVKIGSGLSGFPNILGFEDYFGYGLGNIGDLDGDGIIDLAVGAHRTDDGGVNRGAVHILFMNSNGTVKSRTKISALGGGFVQPYTSLGVSVTGVGDIDGDGVRDMIVGSNDNNDDGGVVWYLMMNANGTVKTFHKISDSAGGTNLMLDQGDFFGGSTVFLGDINNDGVKDIAVGAFNDDDGFADTGAFYVAACDGVSQAGADMFICGFNQVTLAATTPGYSGTWNLIAGTGTITNPTNPNTTVTQLGIGINKFAWNIGSVACKSLDTVNVEVKEPLIADVVSNTVPTCSDLATLTAINPPRGNGMWETTPGLAVIEQPTNLTTNVHLLVPPPVVFRWVVTDVGCPSAEDIVNVTQAAPLIAAVASDSIATCTDMANLLALVPPDGAGHWESDEGSVTIHFPDSVNTSILLGERIPTVFRWKVTKDGCPSAEAQVTVYPFDITEDDLPNVITPNGDGANDTWRILGHKSLIASVFIFNRWGAPVLEAPQYNNTWSGADLAPGTYYYRLRVEGCKEEYKGSIQVLR